MQPATWTWKWLGFERRDTCQGHTTCGHTLVRMSGGITMRMDINLWLGIVTFRVYPDLEGWLMLSVACSWHFLPIPRFYGLYQSCIRVYYHCLDGWIHMIWSIHHIQKSTYSEFLDHNMEIIYIFGPQYGVASWCQSFFCFTFPGNVVPVHGSS